MGCMDVVAGVSPVIALNYITLGILLFAGLLFALHLIFTRQARRDLAAGAVFRSRVRKHVHRGGIWS